MENTKYVFQHKINSLQNEIKPKDDKIKDLKQQILDMEGELTNNVKLLSDNKSYTEEVKGKLVSTAQELVSEKRKVVIANTNLSKVLKEFENLQNVLQDSKKLKSGVLNICNKVVIKQKYFILYSNMHYFFLFFTVHINRI